MDWITEGDKYFERNKEHYTPLNFSDDVVYKMIKLFKINPKRIYEFGACNGARLEFMRVFFEAECNGSDISYKAVEDGVLRFPDVFLTHSAVKDAVIEKPYDLSIVSFVLHWVDRENLNDSIYRINSSVNKGGYLIVNDFYSPNPVTVDYKHNEELKTHKDDYAKYFAKFGFVEIGRMMYKMASNEFRIDSVGYDTSIISVLKKV